MNSPNRRSEVTSRSEVHQDMDSSQKRAKKQKDKNKNKFRKNHKKIHILVIISYILAFILLGVSIWTLNLAIYLEDTEHKYRQYYGYIEGVLGIMVFIYFISLRFFAKSNSFLLSFIIFTLVFSITSLLYDIFLEIQRNMQKNDEGGVQPLVPTKSKEWIEKDQQFNILIVFVGALIGSLSVTHMLIYKVIIQIQNMGGGIGSVSIDSIQNSRIQSLIDNYGYEDQYTPNNNNNEQNRQSNIEDTENPQNKSINLSQISKNAGNNNNNYQNPQYQPVQEQNDQTKQQQQNDQQGGKCIFEQSKDLSSGEYYNQDEMVYKSPENESNECKNNQNDQNNHGNNSPNNFNYNGTHSNDFPFENSDSKNINRAKRSDFLDQISNTLVLVDKKIKPQEITSSYLFQSQLNNDSYESPNSSPLKKKNKSSKQIPVFISDNKKFQKESLLYNSVIDPMLMGENESGSDKQNQSSIINSNIIQNSNQNNGLLQSNLDHVNCGNNNENKMSYGNSVNKV